MRRGCREHFPRHRLQRKPLVSGPVMHHRTCVTHVPWCISGSLTNGGGKNVPGIPGACATRNFMYLARGPWRVWQWKAYFNRMFQFIAVLGFFLCNFAFHLSQNSANERRRYKCNTFSHWPKTDSHNLSHVSSHWMDMDISFAPCSLTECVLQQG